MQGLLYRDLIMKVYEKNDFKARQLKIKKLYCTNNLEFGLKLLPSDKALNKRYVQVNNDKAIMNLVLDLDHTDPLIFEKVNLPPPNFIVIDKNKGTSHLIYSLEKPIYKDYFDNNKTLNFFAKIQQEYTRLLQGDPCYAGLIAKNPLNEHWKVWNINYFYPYSLTELAEYITLPQQIIKRNAIGQGRNCYLFDLIRKWAYKQVLFYKNNGATEIDFRNVLLNQLQKANTFQTPLSFNELKAIAKSISKWTWNHFNSQKFSEIQMKRSHKRKITKHKNSIIGDFLNEYAAK